MGFLDEGETLPWEEAKKLADYIRDNGIEQFLNIYESRRYRNNDELKWGDEVGDIIKVILGYLGNSKENRNIGKHVKALQIQSNGSQLVLNRCHILTMTGL